MRSPFLAALVMTMVPTLGAAQGWEIRAGLSNATATACTEDGSCFGIQCTAVGGWKPGWLAELDPASGGEIPDPILGIRMDGARFAITSLEPSGPTGSYTAAISGRDQELLEALQGGSGIVIDPGRDFAVLELSLRGSRWAIGAILDLCEAGGPDVSVPGDDAGGN